VGTRPVKNLSTTIKAFEIVSEKIPEAKLYVTGSDAERLEQVTNETKDRVFFLGILSKKELRSLYSKIMVVSAPSFYEAFPYGTLEAFASGTPVVGSRAIPPELLVDGQNGYRMTSPENHIELADRIMELLLNKSRWECMSYNAKGEALKYDIQNIVEAYLHLVRMRASPKTLRRSLV
jgi:glycosyltransferase involved in cell wall biosynthesis